MNHLLTILQGDCIEVMRTMPEQSVQCCVTSPPYWGLRDYGVEGQIGLEKTPEEYVAKMVDVFREVKRLLRDDGTLWLNLGDSYNAGRDGGHAGGKNGVSRPEIAPQRSGVNAPNLKPKDLVGIPWRVAFALQADGWYLRQDIIWAKPNPMPESVTDRCTKAHEYIFLLSKSERYFYDNEAIKTPPSEVYANDSRWNSGGTETNYKQGYSEAMAQNPKMPHRVFNGSKPTGINRRSVWTIPEDEWQQFLEWRRRCGKKDVWTVPTSPYSEAHFATFPPDLIKPCILAGTSSRGCCPHCGAPWKRIIENSPMEIDRSERTHELGRTRSSGTMTKPAQSKTTGWEAGCDCKIETVTPCTVLDPFGGSGTTGEVALELGRKAVLIELNPAYVDLIKTRTFVTPGLPL